MSDLREAIRQFAFDIVVTECGLDEDDHDDQMEASERVDAWMEHWDSHERFAAAGRWLALTETGPDYEAAAARVFEVHGYSYLNWPPEWEPAADKHRREARYIVDAALSDYLTEEDR